MRVLIADDEKDMVKILDAYFKKEGFETILAYDGECALELLSSNKVDLAILDWMMPQINGIEVCKYIKENSDTKVLMLTAKVQNEDEIEALSCGADEYIKKPFDPRILIIRAKKLLDFSEGVRFKDLEINLKSKKVYKNDEHLNLTKIEFELLVCLMRNKGIILSREKLLDLVWGIDYEGDYRTVDTHVRRLRSKVGDEIIKTYRGLGYSLEED
ncbi:response regulator transcription factor [Clostridium senegalense]|uniref:Stage 0 sporulation protein A homolog n=1 Tax=Clostridium senegalense TaxID=1465809 RepID=A0A6M0H7M1_9CLOT|nr:response regulator transcription factor [Clostridium senegalense]NEU06304.1 response regulator transcription factor [Clostridium senegalense]